jgi:hypothetical protein
MAKEDAFNATMNSWSMYGGLFKTIADDVGLEKALEYHAKQGEPFGMMIGETLKQQLGDKKPTTEVLKAILQPSMESFGFDPELNVSPTEISLKIPRCPFYEGFKMAGFDHETIGKTCSAMSSVEFAKIKEYYPDIEGSVEYRDSSEGYCLEKFTFK